MIIRLTIIPNDELARVCPVVETLRSAVNTGDMNGMDEATEKLLSLMSGKESIDISEAEWRKFIAEIRAKNPAFQSDYLFPAGICSGFFPNVTPETSVLQLPLDEGEEKYV
jgi:hypothetical protein